MAAEPSNGRYRYNRGVVLAEHGRFAAAIADFDTAIAAHPDLTYARLERGAARLSLGDAGGAEGDWAEAGKRDPALIWTHWYRATGAFVAGRLAAAASGFDRVAAAEPGFAPAPVWRAIAHGRAGSPIAVAAFAGGDWPAPVLDYLRGGISAERLIALPGEDRTSGDRRRVGEALFFIGQSELIAGRRTSARDYFRRALAVTAPRHVWKISAERELRALEAKARSR
ncbi:MAG: tetratricopeptide repeat protein [Sphingomicrobium sp.]